MKVVLSCQWQSKRHVNVNPKAPICEGFLQGYCADGDMCNKKHTYMCREYTLTGKCSSSSTCKLRHPKKTKHPTSPSMDSVGSKREGRYFAPTAPADGECQGQISVSATNVVDDKIAIVLESLLKPRFLLIKRDVTS